MTKYKVMVSNMSYLSLIQVVSAIIPLIVYPYLIRVLGKSTYGLVIFAQVIVGYLLTLVNFGFNIFATKEVSIHRHNKEKLNEIISTVLTIKLIFLVVVFFILTAALSFISKAEGHKMLFFFSLWICIYDIILPVWFFQGIEKMKYISILDFIARATFIILMLLFIKEESDYYLVPLYKGLGGVIAGILAMTIILKTNYIKLKTPSLNHLISYIRGSAPLFASTLILAIKDKFTYLLVGITVGLNSVAVYDLAYKIMKLSLFPIIVVNDAAYPHLAKSKDMIFTRKLIKIMFFVVLIYVAGAQILLQKIILFMDNGMYDAIMPTRIMLLVPLVMVISYSLANNCLVLFDKNKEYLLSTVYSIILYIALIGLGLITNLLQYFMTYVYITIIVFMSELIWRYIFCKKFSLL